MLSRLHRDIDTVQHLLIRSGVGKGHIAEFNAVLLLLHLRRALRDRLRVLHEQHIFIGIIAAFDQFGDIPCQPAQRRVKRPRRLDHLRKNTDGEDLSYRQYADIGVSDELPHNIGSAADHLMGICGIPLLPPHADARVGVRLPLVQHQLPRLVQPDVLSVPEIHNLPSEIAEQSV